MIREVMHNAYVSVMTKFGDLYLAFEPPACRMKNIEDLMSAARGGDVVLRAYDGYVDGKFIPGAYSHSGVVINEREVVHSIAEGVCSCHIGDFVIDVDRFALCRPRYASPEAAWQVIEAALWHCEHNRTQYDFFFSPEADKLYCHEFTATCLRAGAIEIPMTSKKFGVWPFSYSKRLYLADTIQRRCDTIYEFRGGDNG